MHDTTTSSLATVWRIRYPKRGWRGALVYLLMAIDELTYGRIEPVCFWRCVLENRWQMFVDE